MKNRTTLLIISLVTTALFAVSGCVMGPEGEYNEYDEYDEETGALSFSKMECEENLCPPSYIPHSLDGELDSSMSSAGDIPPKPQVCRCRGKKGYTIVQNNCIDLETSQICTAATCTLENSDGDLLTIYCSYSSTNKWKLKKWKKKHGTVSSEMSTNSDSEDSSAPGGDVKQDAPPPKPQVCSCLSKKGYTVIPSQDRCADVETSKVCAQVGCMLINDKGDIVKSDCSYSSKNKWKLKRWKKKYGSGSKLDADGFE
jgi:hypothetical protein